MAERIPLAGVDRSEWLKLRKTGLGGSDAGAVCGVNPYVSSMNVYFDKIYEDIGDQDNEAMRQGRDMEDYVARRFMEATGLKVRRSNYMYRSREYPFMLADVDRFIEGGEAGLECKTASPYQADQWKDGAVPSHYLIQCLHYMAVTGKREWYLAVIIWGQDFQYRRIAWDDIVIQKLCAVEEAFWNGHVVPKIIPEPDGSPACSEAIEGLFPQAEEKQLILPDEFNQELKRRDEILVLKENLAEEQNRIEQRLKLFLGDSEKAKNDRYLISWRNVDTQRLDSKRLKEEQPEIYRQFSKTSHSRRLTVKAA